ncbi:Panacea domain-containing protein [Corynebacterium pseudodiphtheriticum]|uniref:Panacea domain-containing protein n=1 Tax=Corynebacterium pseudodiphtheriticum TaxID=37637 RepID=UPI002542D0AA|nr:Panacea domain-containing protein [Corynebacterium pseudodiphtheriticum]MDK4240267.1 Panacea domain-containing protein [Corynebacterium pseudodiphtheriticum]
MATILDVGQYITELLPGVDKMKLYKLCYFSQGWHLAWTGKPLFSDEFEGWRHGPVSQQLRHRTEAVAKGYTVAEVPGGESARLSAYEAAVVARIVEFYGNQKSTDLSELSHGAAWQATRSGLAPDNPGTNVLSLANIRDEFSGLLHAKTSRPTAPAPNQISPDTTTDDMISRAIALEKEWGPVFDLLATR